MLTSGFFDSYKGDRRYNAEQFSSIFDGVVNDGVYMAIGEHFNVKPAPDDEMCVLVGTGRAWFNHTWTLNDTGLILQLDYGEVNYPRIDAVVLEVDRTREVRTNTIKIIKGTPSKNPVAPTLIKQGSGDNKLNQYLLALVNVAKDSDTIVQANITNKIGTSECPFVTGIIQTINIDDLIAKWGNEWDMWFNDIVDILDSVDPGGSLANAVHDLRQNKADKTVVNNLSTNVTQLQKDVAARHIIRYGTDAPNNAVGIDGDVYIQIVT